MSRRTAGTNSANMLVACRIGEIGFASYLHELRQLGVLDREELHAWLRLHGAIVRSSGRPLEHGERFSDATLGTVVRELGERGQ